MTKDIGQVQQLRSERAHRFQLDKVATSNQGDLGNYLGKYLSSSAHSYSCIKDRVETIAC